MFKYYVFFSAFLIGVPLGVFLLSLWRQLVPWLVAGIVFSMAFPLKLSIAFLGEPLYPQLTTGFEVHAADLGMLVFAIHILLHPKRYNARFMVPVTGAILAYIGVSVLSWATQHHNVDLGATSEFLDARSRFDVLLLQRFDRFQVYLYPLFEISLFCRGLLAFWVSVHIFREQSARTALLYSIAALILYLTVRALMARYVFGDVRVSLGYGHVNVFNTFVALMGIPVATFALARQRFTGSLICLAATFGALLTIVLTVSRSSLSGFLLGCLIVLILSFSRFYSIRNLAYLGLAMLGIAAIGAKAADTFLQRMAEESYSASVEERGLYIATAVAMAKDNLLGVGPGNYSAMAWLKYAEEAGGFTTLVHNIWYLHCAEVGYIGALLYGLVWLRLLQYCISSYIYTGISRDKELVAWLIAGTVCLIPIHVQNFYHHASRFSTVY
ncbi:MAG: O-antigen ligase family protein, partial [Chlamydiia bacterium]|nr:O-antigen ligase family protein [Chlamydiia bacterium]